MSYLSKRSKTAFGSSASCTTILDISTSNRGPCSPSTTRSARGCHPCLRYVPLLMSPGRTMVAVARRKGFEPLTPRFEVWRSYLPSFSWLFLSAHGADVWPTSEFRLLP